MDNSKKYLIKELKKRLNASLEHHLTGPHAILHEVSAFINIYIYIYILMILGKITTLCSSMMGRPDLRPQLMEVRTRKLVLSRAGRTRFQVSSSLSKPRPESARQWMSQTRHWTSHLSVIDKIDGNRCQRWLDELGQTIRYQKQL